MKHVDVLEHSNALEIFQDMMDKAGIRASVTRMDDESGDIPMFIRYFLLNTYETTSIWVEEARIEVESWAHSHTDAMNQLYAVRRVVEEARLRPDVRHAFVDESMREDPSGEDGWDRYSFRIRLQTRNVTQNAR